MHEVFTSVHLANRAYVCHYLNHINFRRIEGLLRSTKPLPSDARITDGVNVSLAIVSPTRSTLLCEGQFDPRQETMGKVATMKMMVRLTAVSAAFIKAMSIATTVLTTKNRDIFTSQRSLPISFASGTSSMGLPLILLGLSLEKGYESFICKSSFLHSPSRAIKKNVRLGRSLYNTLFRESAMLDE